MATCASKPPAGTRSPRQPAGRFPGQGLTGAYPDSGEGSTFRFLPLLAPCETRSGPVPGHYGNSQPSGPQVQRLPGDPFLPTLIAGRPRPPPKPHQPITPLGPPFRAQPPRNRRSPKSAPRAKPRKPVRVRGRTRLVLVGAYTYWEDWRGRLRLWIAHH